ncbi:MAG: hypothetical protein JRE45_10405 [Deltaproteobacteria bacterium]|nr:hypothetical protein [Deltaproteobacteria bacterium]
MKHLLTLACATISCAAVVVHAQTDKPEEVLAPQSHQLSASPDAPQMAFYWSGHLRARLSARIPFIGGLQEPGFSMALLPLIELQNQDGSDQALPNENWRGRLSVQGAWTWGEEPDAPRFSLGGAIEHESDHATARSDAPDVSLQLNDVVLLGAVQIPKPRLMIRLDMQAITYVISCTDLESACRDFSGSTSFGGIADLMLDAGGARPVKGKWYMFGSVHGAGIVPNDGMVRELRASLNFGVWTRSRLGMWQFYALGFFGNEVGIDRGVRWVP